MDSSQPFLRRSYTANPDLSPPFEAAPKAERKHRPHDHHFHRHHRHHQRDKRVPQSAIQLRSHATFGEVPRRNFPVQSAGGTPSSSQLHLRADGSGTTVDQAGQYAVDPAMTKGDQAFTERALARKRENSGVRTKELCSSLSNLNDVSNSTTRRLDDVYYSILEKLSTLHSTVSSLQDLTRLSHQLHENFEGEARVAESEVQDEIDGFGSFDTQQTKIRRLQGRVYEGKEKVEILGHRLEKVRSRVEKWEQKESEWQIKTTSQYRPDLGGLSAFRRNS
ncbi:MAG: hypothetical protein M1837_003066 [Sclerophora amabilis]|nr:MAG: hypothetical protein M1837_003066 [Sclerophora amabilis]